MKMLFDKVDALERNVRRRDMSEYAAACFVMAFFGWRAAVTTEPLVRIGAVIVVLGSIFIILWSRRAATPSFRRGINSDRPVAEFCARELSRVEAQLRLLRTVAWWYVEPTIVGLLVMTNAGHGSTTYKVSVSTGFVAFGWLIH